MKLTDVSIRNYRCIQKLDLAIDDYTALVGTNGAGKSSVLYALDWFFNGHDLEIDDLTQRGGKPLGSQVEVTATFSDLTNRDREILREYGRSERATFRRTCTPGQKGTKVVGRAMQGPGFSNVHNAKGIADMRSAYRALASELDGLETLTGSFSRDQAKAALADWEDNPDNESQLVPVDNIDANHMFGINGTNAIRECINFVLIPAATDMQAQFQDGARGAAITELLGALVKNAGDQARDAWMEENKDLVTQLNRSVEKGVEKSVSEQSKRINQHLQKTVPNASVKFNPSVPTWTPKNEASISTAVTVDGITNDIARQGHGVQRSILIALFQSLVPNSPGATHADTEANQENDAPTEEGSERTGPALIVSIEEPEIYQHPIRARAFGRVLSELSNQQLTQVLIATHSPYFVPPKKFGSIRRFRTDGGFTRPSSTSISLVTEQANSTAAQVQKTVDKQLPTNFSEGFFADAVVVVEGDTDRAVLEALAERLNTPLDERGISVLELGGKGSLRIPYQMLSSLEIPTYLIADGDADGASRVKEKAGEDIDERRRNVNESHRSSTEKLIGWLPPATASQGFWPYAYGAPSVVTDKFTIWRDDLETELGQWTSFVKALEHNNGKLRQKHAITYRLAVQEAKMSDVPSSLTGLIDEILKFSS
ncbi:AAA family ATPase [Brevibacterium sp. SIMBA_078]|uniref:ATP-dependent nuclease n=1 Tax=Brevibacterium sp. SIMBA_078 TaxID=3085816 RepID=UPI003978FBDE